MCVLPILNILAISLSSSAAAGSGEVRFWPVDFTWKSYNFVTAKPEFMQSFWVSVRRVLVGVPVNMVLTILVAYPLSKTKHQFHARQFYVWFFFITMLFSGGLIPYYMTISKVGLVDSFWAMILPGAVLKSSSIKTIGLCHSVQSCTKNLMDVVGMDCTGVEYKIAGINHQAWLLEVTKDGRDLYPEIKSLTRTWCATRL